MFGNINQSWIELDEGGVDGCVLFVAGVAGRFFRDHLGRILVIESEECPFAREAGFILDVNLASHQLRGLKMTTLIDGGIAARATHLKHEHGFVRPGAGLQEGFVRIWVDKNRVKHRVSSRTALKIAHIDARTQVDPLTIICREDQLAICRICRRLSGRATCSTLRLRKRETAA